MKKNGEYGHLRRGQRQEPGRALRKEVITGKPHRPGVLKAHFKKEGEVNM